MKRLTPAAMLLVLASPQAFAADDNAMIDDCRAYAARTLEADPLKINLSVQTPRVDGTIPVNGEVEGSEVTFQCSYNSAGTKMVEWWTSDAAPQQENKAQKAEPSQATEGTAAAPANGDVPNYERPVGGVLPPGSSFTASTQVECSRDGSKMTRCDAGVVREGNGNGFVTVFWPDGGNRVLYFEDGTIVRYDESEADGGAKLTVTRSGDVQTVTVGRARFQIFDALLVGG